MTQVLENLFEEDPMLVDNGEFLFYCNQHLHKNRKTYYESI